MACSGPFSSSSFLFFSFLPFLVLPFLLSLLDFTRNLFFFFPSPLLVLNLHFLFLYYLFSLARLFFFVNLFFLFLFLFFFPFFLTSLLLFLVFSSSPQFYSRPPFFLLSFDSYRWPFLYPLHSTAKNPPPQTKPDPYFTLFPPSFFSTQTPKWIKHNHKKLRSTARLTLLYSAPYCEREKKKSPRKIKE